MCTDLARNTDKIRISFIRRNRTVEKIKYHFGKILSLRNIVAARFSIVNQQRSLRPIKFDMEKAVSEGTLVPGVARNRRAKEESNGKPPP